MDFFPDSRRRSSLPVKATKGTKNSAGSGKAATRGSAPNPQALEQRLDRLEHLVLLIAHQVGVPPEAIERLLPLASSDA